MELSIFPLKYITLKAEVTDPPPIVDNIDEAVQLFSIGKGF